MKTIFLSAIVAGAVIHSCAAEAQEGIVDYSTLTDYPAEAIHENNWTSDENIRAFSREFELKPTRMLARGKTVYPLEQGTFQDLGKLRFNVPDEQPMTMNEAFELASVDGYIVTKDGKIVYEQYFDGFSEDGFHSWYSGSKSLVGLAFGYLEPIR